MIAKFASRGGRMRSAHFMMVTVVTVFVLWNCSCAESPPPQVTATPEDALRARLGVPGDAKTVILFGQNAHLDIDWQKTFPAYYQSYVQDIFLQARQLLDGQDRAHYSIAEMGYLKRHLD